MTENPTPGPWYLGHFSEAAAGAVYVIRVTTDPLLALRALGVLEREIARVMQFAAKDARAQGATWNDVAEALQVSRQSAHARFAAAAAEPDPTHKRLRPDRVAVSRTPRELALPIAPGVRLVAAGGCSCGRPDLDAAEDRHAVDRQNRR